MKIVKDELYFYNKGSGLYIVKASGKDGGMVFSGKVVFIDGNVRGVELGEISDLYSKAEFKRLSNKITTGEE